MNSLIFLVSFLLFFSCSVPNCSNLQEAFSSYEEAVTAIELTTFNFAEACDTSKSSFVRGAHYYSCNEETGFLLIRANGRNYIYQDVPISLWNDFKKADSYGRFYNANIKGKYDLELAN